MSRRRYQQPEVFKTTGKRPMWYFRARVDVLAVEDGQRVTKRPLRPYYLGYVDEMGKQAARKKRDEILAAVINKPQVLIPSQVKFSEVLAVYKREHLSEKRETTRAMQESVIRQHIEPGLGALRMCDIDALAIQRWLTGMELSYTTKKGALALLRVIWTKAEDWGYTQQRFPARKNSLSIGVDRPVKGHEMPTMDQLRRLLSALEDPYRAMAEIALYSGLRISEIRGLQWQDVGTDTVLVRRRVSASGHVDVPKSKKAWRALDVRPLKAVFDRLPKDSDWIFRESGHSYAMCQRYMAKARKTAGIKVARFSWHHLRAIFNTLARTSGADSMDRQAMMGHATESMNAVYVMQGADDLKRRGDLMMQVQGLIIGETKGKVQ